METEAHHQLRTGARAWRVRDTCSRRARRRWRCSRSCHCMHCTVQLGCRVPLLAPPAPATAQSSWHYSSAPGSRCSRSCHCMHCTVQLGCRGHSIGDAAIQPPSCSYTCYVGTTPTVNRARNGAVLCAPLSMLNRLLPLVFVFKRKMQILTNIQGHRSRGGGSGGSSPTNI